jgi:undecaprenyl-diphosphatase
LTQASKEPIETIEQAVKDETTSPPRREYRMIAFQVALFSAVGAFAVLTLIVSSTPLLAVDIQITKALQSISNPFFAAGMEWISWPGFLPQSVLIPALVALLFYRLGLQWEALTALVAASLPALLNELAKDWIRRPRPTVDLVHVLRILDSYSFPSGHVMFYTGFFGFLWFVVFTLFRPSLQRTVLLTFLGSLIVLVGISRIYLGQHWASDILGAFLLGGLNLVLILQFYRWGKARFFLRQPVAPG